MVWGLILALIALGLCLIYGLMGIINIAHGSLYMVGAVVGVYCANKLGLNFWVMLLVVPVGVALLGVLLNEVLFARIVRRDPAIGLLATAGLLLIIDMSSSLFSAARLSPSFRLSRAPCLSSGCTIRCIALSWHLSRLLF